MNGVLGMAELLLDSNLDDRPLHLADATYRSAENLLGVINNTLDFAKLEAGRLELAPGSFAIRRLVEDVVEMYAPQAAAKGLEIVADIQPDLARYVSGDGLRLRQVLINLVGNAIKCSESGTVILRVSSVATNDGIARFRFVVKDEGVGIPEAYLPRLFEPFSKVEAPSAQRFVGAGLGLAISRRLIELMGGSIEVSSAQGTGTSMRVDLPFAIVEQAVPPIGLGALRDLDILVVDGNEAVAHTLCRQLDAWGMRSQAVASAEAASKQLARVGGRYAVDGVIVERSILCESEQVFRFEENAADEACPVVLVLDPTPEIGKPKVTAEIEFGIVVPKPVRQEVLLQTLKAAFNRRDDEASIEPDNKQALRPARPAFAARVLLAEDNRINQEVAMAMLEQLGCSVDLVDNGREAVRTAFASAHDLVLMDCHMPDVDGFQAAREIRRLEKERNVDRSLPIIAITADVQPGIEQTCIDAGMNDYLSKPYSEQKLASVLERWLPGIPEANSIEQAQVPFGPDDAAGNGVAVSQSVQIPDARDQALLDAAPQILGRLRIGIDDADRSALRSVARELAELSSELGDRKLAGLAQAMRTECDSASLSALAVRAQNVADSLREHFDHALEVSAASMGVRDSGKSEGFIFVVDDDALFRKSVRQSFHDEGFSVEEACSGPAALARLRDLTPDLIIIDALMPVMQHLDDRTKKARRRDEKFSVLFIDLDGFKDVNDTLGHDTGDYLLTIVARRLQAVTRDTDFVARLGGDEFCILLDEDEDSTAMGAAEAAARCLNAIAKPVELRQSLLRPNASIGIARYPDDGASNGALLRAADSAMYAAKRSGKHQYAFYQEAMTDEAEKRLTLEQAVRNALELELFELHYQPQVELRSGRIVGTEALIRCRSAALDGVSPADLIAVIERIGLIAKLGQWVIREACSQLVTWKQQGFVGLRMAINVSACQFSNADLLACVNHIIADPEVDANSIELEITESTVQSNVQAVRLLRKLKDLGLRIAIDDFGTGYSSLGSLRHLPIDTLKIDRVFIKELVESPEDSILLGTITGLAHALSLSVVGEGVEELEQVQILSGLGCDVVQGFYFARPMSAADMGKLLKSLDNRSMFPASRIAAVEH
jgi:diguanylate cyclase (GGDEF)-like protein